MLFRSAEKADQAGGIEIKDATRPAATTPPELASWQNRQRVANYLIPVLAGGNIVCNAYLVQSYRAGATAKGVLGRFLPDGLL